MVIMTVFDKPFDILFLASQFTVKKMTLHFRKLQIETKLRLEIILDVHMRWRIICRSVSNNLQTIDNCLPRYTNFS